MRFFRLCPTGLVRCVSCVDKNASETASIDHWGAERGGREERACRQERYRTSTGRDLRSVLKSNYPTSTVTQPNKMKDIGAVDSRENQVELQPYGSSIQYARYHPVRGPPYLPRLTQRAKRTNAGEIMTATNQSCHQAFRGEDRSSISQRTALGPLALCSICSLARCRLFALGRASRPCGRC